MLKKKEKSFYNKIIEIHMQMIPCTMKNDKIIKILIINIIKIPVLLCARDSLARGKQHMPSICLRDTEANVPMD